MKNFFLFAALIALISSCSKREDRVQGVNGNSNNLIDFKTYVDGAESKAVTKDMFVAGDTFGVFAYGTGMNDYKNGAFTPDVINNLPVVLDDNYEWNLSEDKFWPEDNSDGTKSQVSFFTYYPYNAEGVVFSADMSTPMLTYNVSKDLMEHVDLMWGVSPDGTPNLDKTSDNGVVNSRFKHALSSVAIELGVKAADDNKGEDIRVTSVEFGGNQWSCISGGFYSNGTLNLNSQDADWNAIEPVLHFELDSSNFDNDGYFYTDEDVMVNPVNKASNMLLIPQSFQENELAIIVNYTEDGEAKSILKPVPAVEFEAGYSYILQVNINATSSVVVKDKIEMDGSMDDWKDGVATKPESVDGNKITRIVDGEDSCGYSFEYFEDRLLAVTEFEYDDDDADDVVTFVENADCNIEVNFYGEYTGLIEVDKEYNRATSFEIPYEDTRYEYFYNSSNQLIEVQVSDTGVDSKYEVSWSNGNLVGINLVGESFAARGCTISYTDLLNDNNLDLNMMFMQTEVPSVFGFSVFGYVSMLGLTGERSLNMPETEVTNYYDYDDDSCKHLYNLTEDDKIEFVESHRDSGSVYTMKIEYEDAI